MRVIPADTVFISIGDAPDLEFLPADIAVERGFVKVDEDYQTSNPKVFAIGDAVRPGSAHRCYRRRGVAPPRPSTPC